MRIFQFCSVATLSLKLQLNRKGAKSAKKGDKIKKYSCPKSDYKIASNFKISLRTLRLCGKERLFKGLILITVLLFTSLAAIAEGNDPLPKLSLSLSLGKNEAYPGETVPITVTLRINNETVRNIGYPRLDAPNGKTIAFSPPVQESEVGAPDVILHRFTGQISGIKPGRLVVGPARLDCEVMNSATGSAAFFGGQEPESLKLTSIAAPFTVLPLPTSGKPEYFSGAIGTFSLSVTSLPAQITTGEPLTVTTTIRGVGSLADAACPAITGSGLQSFPVQATRGTAQLICEQVVVPGSVMRFPPVTWSYFDPEQHRYKVLSGEVGSRVVAKPPAATTQPALPYSTLAKVPSNRKSIFTSFFMLFVLAVVVVLCVLTLLLRKRGKTMMKNGFQNNFSQLKVLLWDAEAAVANGNVDLFYNIAFEVMQITENVGKPYEARSDGIRAISRTDDEERHRLIAVTYMIAACDKVRYGRILPNTTSLLPDLERLKKILSFTL
jgi:hypothetical protein